MAKEPQFVDRRQYAGRISAMHHDGIPSVLDIYNAANSVFTQGWQDVGGGRQMQIDRERFAALYTDFPNAPTQADDVRSALAGKGLVVWGAGTVGRNSAENAKQLGMKLTFIDISEGALQSAQTDIGGDTLKVSKDITASEKARILDLLSSKEVDALNIGVLIPGAPAPQLLTKAEIVDINRRRAASDLKPLVIADAAIDQGGCIEGERATTHDCPIDIIGGSPVISVANIPGSKYTAAYASKMLWEATKEDLKRSIKAAAYGWESVLAEEPLMATAINTMGGKITHPAVSDRFSELPADSVDAMVAAAKKPSRGKIKLVIPGPVKPHEHRVGILPSGVKELKQWAQSEGIDLEVAIDANLGEPIPSPPGTEEISHAAYQDAGAELYTRRDRLMDFRDPNGNTGDYHGFVYHFTKEPQGDELGHIRAGSIVHTYFHYTGFPDTLTKWALDRKITSVAFETRKDEHGRLPTLYPMSHVDGRSNTLHIAAVMAGIMEFREKPQQQ